VSYIFDSSAIFKAIRENLVENLAGNYTLELARYELGNALWKEHTVRGKIDADELRRLAMLVKSTLNILTMLEVGCREEEILTLAGKLRLTFYDASYTYLAQEKKLPLITEDRSLLNKARRVIEALTLDAIIK
jgi:predicted nucleic acid-binding protein